MVNEIARSPGPVRLLKPLLSYGLSAVAGGLVGHSFNLLGSITAGADIVQLDFNNVVVMILVVISSYFIALIPICVMALIGAPLAGAAHILFRASGIDYRYLCPVAGALIALVSVNLFFAVSDGFAERIAAVDKVSILSSLAGGAFAGLLFWRQAIRPLLPRS
jgi:hypothetical protein